MRIHVLEREQRLPAPPATVFPFFADARNLEAITPPLLRFRVVTPEPIDMRPGARIEYRLRLRGVPIRWLTEIQEWDPPHRFVDAQLRGPYKLCAPNRTWCLSPRWMPATSRSMACGWSPVGSKGAASSNSAMGRSMIHALDG